MTDAPKLLLAHHLKTLKLPTFLREYDKLARQCATEGLDHVQFLEVIIGLDPFRLSAPPLRFLACPASDMLSEMQGTASMAADTLETFIAERRQRRRRRRARLPIPELMPWRTTSRRSVP